MESKTEGTMWKSIKNCLKNRCQKWPCILFGANYQENKQCHALKQLVWCSLAELSAVLKDIERHGSEWSYTCRVQLEKLSAKLLSFFSASVPKLPTKVDSLVTSFTSSSVICDENLPLFKVLKRISWSYHFTLSVDGRVSCWLTARQKWWSLSCLWFLITLWIGASLLPFVSSISSVPAYVTST